MILRAVERNLRNKAEAARLLGVHTANSSTPSSESAVSSERPPQIPARKLVNVPAR
jgi:hypothetical protein